MFGKDIVFMDQPEIDAYNRAVAEYEKRVAQFVREKTVPAEGQHIYIEDIHDRVRVKGVRKFHTIDACKKLEDITVGDHMWTCAIMNRKIIE